MKLVNIKKEIDNKLILDDINLEIIKSGLVIIRGESGSGKTTLLNIIANIDEPTSGYIKENNNDIAILFQDNNLFENLTVEENLQIYENVNIDEILKKLKLFSLKKQKVKNISVGEKRRVSIARTLLLDSSIILLDEPNTNLDDENISNIFNILKELSQNKLFICTIHGCDYVDELANQIITISNCKIIDNKIINNKENDLKSQTKLTSKKFINKITKYFLKQINIIHFILITILLTSYFIINMIGNYNLVDTQVEILNKESNNKILFNYKENILNKIPTKYYWKNDTYMHLEITNKETKNNYYMVTPINYFYYYINLNSKIIGNEPINENEIMISELLAEKIIFHGIKNQYGEEQQFKNKKELLNQVVSFSGIPVKITGIIKQDLEKYMILKNYELWSHGETEKNKLIYKELNFLNEISYMSEIIYVKPNFNNYISQFDEQKEVEVAIPTFIESTNIKDQKEYLNILNNKNKKITLRNIEYEDLTNGTIYSYSINHYLKKYYKVFLIIKYLLPIIIILLLIEVNSIHQIIIKKNKKDLLQLKVLKLSDKSITKIISKSIIYLILLSLLLSLVITKVIAIVLNEIATSKVEFYFKPFNINVNSIFLIVIIILVIHLITKFSVKKNTKKFNLTQLRNI